MNNENKILPIEGGAPAAPVFYTSITKLSLAKFLNALCDGELSSVLISGEATETQLNEAWDELLSQYIEASAGPKQLHYIKLCGQAKRLEIKYNVVVMLINILRQCYVERFGNRLNDILSTSFKFEISDLSKYHKLLNSCHSRAKSFLISMELKADQAKAMSKQFAGEVEPPTREDFSKTLIALSDHAGYPLLEEQISVFTYCERVKRFNKYVENLQQQKSKPVSVNT